MGRDKVPESLGTVKEEAVCGHMFQGLFLKDPNGSQMEGWREGGGWRQGGQQKGWEVLQEWVTVAHQWQGR